MKKLISILIAVISALVMIGLSIVGYLDLKCGFGI